MDDPQFRTIRLQLHLRASTRAGRCTERFRAFLILFVPVLLLLGCGNTANRLTVARTTILPPLQTAQDTAAATQDTAAIHGTAIHLDAQQRLVLATAQGYCAEPSPDAMSAYASSIGLGLRVSPDTAASAAEALQSYAGSIGLRTQSITLMRDALYRMCEASNNDHLADWEIAAFLRRSQDLTAVILAVEQLTGAVVADQITLAPGSTATVITAVPSDLQSTTPVSAEEEQGSVAEPVGVAGGQQEEAAEPGGAEGEQEEVAEPSGAEGEEEGAAEPDGAEGEEEGAAEPDGAEGAESAGPSDAAIAVREESQRRSGFQEDVSAHSIRLVHPQTSAAVAAAVEAMVTRVLKKDYRSEMCLSFMGSMLTDRDIHAALTQFIPAGYVAAILGICRDIIMQDMERDGRVGNGGTAEDREENAGGESDVELPTVDDISPPVRVPGG